MRAGAGPKSPEPEPTPVYGPLPGYWLAPRSLERRAEPDAVDGVRGAIMTRDLLSRAECETFVQLAETLGFTDGEQTVAVPRDVRANDAVVMIAPPEMLTELSTRLSGLLPDSGAGGCPRVQLGAGISARLRCYRYVAPEEGHSADHFAAHHDGAQTPAGAIAGGGHTVFHPASADGEECKPVRWEPSRTATTMARAVAMMAADASRANV
ncbi:hypothetical protein T492DRAFT_879624 [Pavlovales sp. CCMP2436]|nr:hypothetical protein T492DRAFT_879624 [Pavlovales sp. CCMP2436]